MLLTPLAMKKVDLFMVDIDAPLAAMMLARLGVLHPYEEVSPDSPLDSFPAAPYQQVYHDLGLRFDKIAAYVGKPFAPVTTTRKIVTLERLRDLDEQLRALWVKVSAIEEQLRRQREKIGAIRQLSGSLQRFAALDLDLSRLRRRGRFLRIFVGSVPSANLDQLRRALTLTGFLTRPFFSSEGIDHVVVFGSSEQYRDAQEVLKSADFRGLTVPDEFSGSPAQLQRDLDRQIVSIERRIEALTRELNGLIETNFEILQHARDCLILARPYAGVAGALRGKGRLVRLEGWVPAKYEGEIRRQLEQDLACPFHIEFADPEPAEYASVPSVMPRSWLLRPFQMLVRNFGIPSYREVDPTGLFALTYILMFGMMFGDIGHGAVILIAGLGLWKRFPAATVVAVLAGISSMGFGLVYGSLFGYEHVIEPLWMSPMQDPVRLLTIAVIWGAGFILFANLIAIRNLWAAGQAEQALYSGKGVAGLAFYLALCFAAYRAFSAGRFGWPESLALALPLAVIMWSQWRHSSGQVFERVLVVFIEGLEHVISNISGTLSFLRVAAFSLNHIALAAAVFAIAGMLGSAGHIVTVVLGNLFVIVLEGAIVAIQCLRLEYYEGFSRFFSGNGRAFEPLKLES